MKFRTTLTVIIIIISIFRLKCQEIENKRLDNVYLEIAGIAGHYSFNYSRTIPITNNIGLLVGIGFSPSLVPLSNRYIDWEFSPRFPMRLMLYIGHKRHYVDMGLGVTPYTWYVDDDDFGSKIQEFSFAWFYEIGYRYKFKNNNYFIGASFSPLIIDQGFEFYPWGSLKAGYIF